MKNKINAIRPSTPTDPDKIKAEVIFDFSRLAADEEHEIHALLKLAAPEKEIERKPLHLVAAIDISSSMHGEKIQRAKESCAKLVEHLTDQDYFILYTFDNMVTREKPSGFMTDENKQRLLRRISGLHPRGSTNLSGVYMEGLNAFKETEGQVGAIRRFMLFTDGQPTTGITDDGQFLAMVDAQKTDEVSVSTFGYGAHHAVELMTTIADRQNGNFYYVEQPDDCAEAFATELGGLLSMYGQNLKVSLESNDGFEFELLTQLEKDDHDRVIVSDIYGGEQRSLTVKVDVNKHKKMPRDFTALKGKISYDNLVTGKRDEVKFAGKVRFVKKDDADKEPNKEVTQQVIFDKAANAHQQAQNFADAGNYGAAQQLISQTIGVVGAGWADQLGLSTADYASSSYTANSTSMKGLVRGMRSRRSAKKQVYTSSLNEAQRATISHFVDTEEGSGGAVILEGQGNTVTSNSITINSNTSDNGADNA